MTRKKGLAGVLQQTQGTAKSVKKNVKRIENMPGVKLGKYIAQDPTPTIREFRKFSSKN